jgi:hypothetical protein
VSVDALVPGVLLQLRHQGARASRCGWLGGDQCQPGHKYARHGELWRGLNGLCRQRDRIASVQRKGLYRLVEEACSLGVGADKSVLVLISDHVCRSPVLKGASVAFAEAMIHARDAAFLD